MQNETNCKYINPLDEIIQTDYIILGDLSNECGTTTIPNSQHIDDLVETRHWFFNNI